MVVALIGRQLVGLLADSVSDIVAVDPATIKPVPCIAPHADAGTLSGIATVDGTMITLIDLSRSFLSEFNAGAAIAGASSARPSG